MGRKKLRVYRSEELPPDTLVCEVTRLHGISITTFKRPKDAADYADELGRSGHSILVGLDSYGKKRPLTAEQKNIFDGQLRHRIRN